MRPADRAQAHPRPLVRRYLRRLSFVARHAGSPASGRAALAREARCSLSGEVGRERKEGRVVYPPFLNASTFVILSAMSHPKKERTFVILKPDTIQRSLTGEIINRIERTGLKLVGIKMINADEERLTEHYGKEDQWYLEKGTKRVKLMQEFGKTVDPNRPPIEYGKDIIRGVIRYMQSSPVVVMVWEGNQAVAVVRKIVGTTDPTTSDVGTIRGDYQIDSYTLSDSEERGIRNILHCSDQTTEALREIGIWFSPEELMDYRHINEAVLEDASLKGISE